MSMSNAMIIICAQQPAEDQPELRHILCLLRRVRAAAGDFTSIFQMTSM